MKNWTKEMIDECEGPPRPEFTDVEEAYRRGYSQGVHAANLGLVTTEEAYSWRNGIKETGAPGTIFKEEHMHGLTKNDPHRFFLNTMKHPKEQNWNE